MVNERRAEIKDRLKEALAVRGMRAIDLAERSGVPKSAISFYLAGKSKPKADRLYIIAQVLDVNEAWLLGYNVPMARTDEAKKNDILAQLVLKMRKDPEFFEAVHKLSLLDVDGFNSICQLLTVIGKK